MAIRIKNKDGFIEAISPGKFCGLFNIEHSRKMRMPRKLPGSFLSACAVFGAKPDNKVSPRQMNIYRHKIAAGYVAPTYIAKINDEVGYGLFANRDLRPGEMIGEYTGTLSRDWAADVRKPADFNPYLLRYPFDCPYAIDARRRGNEMRFVNHSSKNNNAKRLYVCLDGILHVIFVAEKLIPKHGQILLDYGKRFWRLESRRRIDL